jgi:hypothetical protein
VLLRNNSCLVALDTDASHGRARRVGARGLHGHETPRGHVVARHGVRRLLFKKRERREHAMRKNDIQNGLIEEKWRPSGCKHGKCVLKRQPKGQSLRESDGPNSRKYGKCVLIYAAKRTSPSRLCKTTRSRPQYVPIGRSGVAVTRLLCDPLP